MNENKIIDLQKGTRSILHNFSMSYTKDFFRYFLQSIYLCVVNLSATPPAIVWSVGGAMASQPAQ